MPTAAQCMASIVGWLTLHWLIGSTDAVDNRLFSGSLKGEDRKTLLLKNFLHVNNLRKRIKRESAFYLLKLESQLDAAAKSDGSASSGGLSLQGASVRRDDTLNDQKCQQACNEKLRSGLDMVKAHLAFGSVGVPSVLDRLDLQMFCRLDASHDRCLRDCGFEIHFNMRDYVCLDHFDEMVAQLPCYERSATQLKRKCGTQRCGPYAELEVSSAGFAQRCRSLLCDLRCIEGVLTAQCGRPGGERAAKFLVDYSRAQISTWMRDMSNAQAQPIARIIPPSCARLFCERFNAQNCTSIIEPPPKVSAREPPAGVVAALPLARAPLAIISKTLQQQQQLQQQSQKQRAN